MQLVTGKGKLSLLQVSVDYSELTGQVRLDARATDSPASGAADVDRSLSPHSDLLRSPGNFQRYSSPANSFTICYDQICLVDEKGNESLHLEFPLTVATVPYRIPNAPQPMMEYGKNEFDVSFQNLFRNHLAAKMAL